MMLFSLSRPLTSHFTALLAVLLIAFFAGMTVSSRADEIEPEPSSDAPVVEKAPTKDQPAPTPQKQVKQPAGHVHAAPPPPPRSFEEVVKDIWTRDKLSGDWRGLRTDLHDHGIDIGLRLSQYGQGVAIGGVDKNGEYGARMDYRLHTDLHKLAGFWEGLTIDLHAMTRFGNDISADAGGFVLPNAGLLLPMPGNYSDSDITGLTITQSFFDGRADVFAGKLDVIDLVTGFFPHVAFGQEGFWNVNALLSALPWFGAIQGISLWGTGGWTLKDGWVQEGSSLPARRMCRRIGTSQTRSIKAF